MAKPERGMPSSILRRTSPKSVEPADAQAESEAQGRGVPTFQDDDGGPARGRQAPRGKKPRKEAGRDIKVVNVPRDVCKLLDLEAIETERTQSEVVIDLLRRHLPNRYVSTRGDQGKGEPVKGEQTMTERTTTGDRDADAA
jgi:hypothetical protein